jgi:hypothetical protein
MIDIDDFKEYLKRCEIPPEPPKGSSPFGNTWDHADISMWVGRDDIISRGMWAIVDKIWTKKLAKWIGGRTCLEVMAGAGWLAKALSEYGIDIIATDNGAWDARHSKMVIVHPIEKLNGIEATHKYCDRDILIISWPPYGDMDICHICEQWMDKLIIYIGEDDGGCNAPEEFWQRFNTIKPQPRIPLMAWSGIRDSVYIGIYSEKQTA